MFIYMPQRTSDVLLTVFQSLLVDGIIFVTSIQKLVAMIVGKTVKMAEMLYITVQDHGEYSELLMSNLL